MEEDDIFEKSLGEYEETYKSLLRFYEYAEELVDTIDKSGVEDHVAQLKFIEPMVEELEEATDILTAEYRHYVKTGKKPGIFVRKKIERSLEKIHQVLYNCNKFVV